MMLRDRLDEALKQSLLQKDAIAVTTLRLVLAALKDRDITERGRGNMCGVDDAEIMALLQSMIKQRKESMQFYERGGRAALAEQEAQEIQVISQFLPPQLSNEETAMAVRDAVDEIGAGSLKDMGRVMGFLKQRYSGRMDFGKAGAMLRSRLS